MILFLVVNANRQICSHKPFDPISVANIDVVGDWVVEKNELFSVDNEPSNWMLLNQSVEAPTQWVNVDDEEIEAFLAGKLSFHRSCVIETSGSLPIFY